MQTYEILLLIWLVAGIIGFYSQIYLNEEYQKILDKFLKKENDNDNSS